MIIFRFIVKTDALIYCPRTAMSYFKNANYNFPWARYVGYVTRGGISNSDADVQVKLLLEDLPVDFGERI